MRIVIAGGGTGGHTSAGLAVAASLQRRGGIELHWVGTADGVEARRASEAGIAFHAVAAGKLRRYWDRRNIRDLLVRVPAGLAQSLSLLRELRPDLLFATGGFVALPPALAARALRIPLVIHEQTVVPGLANRIAGRFARRIALSFPPADRTFPPDRITVTGNPLRPELEGGVAGEAFRVLGLEWGLPLVYVTGGAQGSHRVNRAVGAVLPDLLERAVVAHQCGDNPATGDREWLAGEAARLPVRLRGRYALRPWVGEELRHIYAAAALVVSRSGAGTVNECCHLGRPAIYVPLPGTSGDEQTANARYVAGIGGAVVLPQSELDGARLLEHVRQLLDNPEALRRMGEAARRLARPDAADRIAALLIEVVRGRYAA
ncbi:MAG: undecaprenyldiphospho-muramoylpentapeptide beta-N-acetylglucosaminyltransferase [Candidatus Rokubacteria bacterium]|nr:undecaprenyldiphospho-muramoylpentapeptide beta-N-acetylglucosaminyltransferase [Candidatus Rokubacteria bacterium]